jgi:hypothetical protein
MTDPLPAELEVYHKYVNAYLKKHPIKTDREKRRFIEGMAVGFEIFLSMTGQ